MGMFDNLKINPEKLPVSEAERAKLAESCNGGFQTKNVRNMLTIVEITDDGQLRWEDFDSEEVPKEERPYPNEEGILGLFGSIRHINERWVYEANFTGEVRFYDEVENEWYEFCALFKHGKLLDIVKISPT